MSSFVQKRTHLSSVCWPQLAFLIGFLFAMPIHFGFAQEETSNTPSSRTDRVVASNRSLQWVPLQCDYYEAHFALRSQWDRLSQSEWSSQLQSTEIWRKFRDALLVEWGDRKGELRQVRSTLQNPIVKDVIAFGIDLLSQDVFLFADNHLSKTIDQLTIIQSKANLLGSDQVSNETKAEIVYEWIDQIAPNVQFPTLVLGARFSDAEKATAKVDEIEGLIRLGLGRNPDLQPVLRALKRIEDARGSRLLWSIQGSMLPWDSFPTNEIVDREAMNDLREAFEDKHLSLSIGTLDGFFVVLISGESNVNDLFGRQETLIEHQNLVEVRKHLQDDVSAASAAHPLTHLKFISDELARSQQMASLDGFFSKLAKTALQPAIDSLEKSSDLREWWTSVHDDAPWLDSQIGSHVPHMRGSTTWTFLNGDGWETQGLDRTQTVVLDGSRPLAGLDRLGDQPLIALSIRLADHPEYFATARQILKRLKNRLEGLSKVDPREIPEPQVLRSVQVVLQSWPMLRELADIWEEDFLPSLNGEYTFVMHFGGLVSMQWHPNIPPSNQPLPIPEFALAAGIRDESKWMAGARRLRDWIQQTLIQLPMDGDTRDSILAQFPKRIPLSSASYQTFGIPIPDTCPAPKSMMPRVTLGSGWAIASYSDDQSNTMNHDEALTKGLFAIDPKQPLASAALIDLGGIVANLRPWLNYVNEVRGQPFRVPLQWALNQTGQAIEITSENLVELWGVFEELGELASSSQIDDRGQWRWRSVYRHSRSAQ